MERAGRRTLTAPMSSPSPAVSAPAAQPRLRLRLHREYGLLALFVVTFAYFTLTTPHFAEPRNLLQVLQVHAPVGVLAAGMTLVILTGGIDLSVGSAVALAAVCMGLAWKGSGSPWLTLLAGAGAGTLCGAVNGVLVSAGRVPPLIVTLATLSVFRGLAYALGGSSSVGRFPPPVLAWSRDLLLGAPVSIWITALLLLGLGIYLARTDGGRAVYAVGANAGASELSGVPVRSLRLRIYLATGLLAGLAAILYTAQYNSVRADVGRDYELTAITMVVLGGTSVAGGEGSMVGTALGFLTLIFIENGIVLKGWTSEWHGVVVAVLLIGALLLDAGFRRRALRA
jgi:ribose/xylose/arabinose/galactoside ABC-type transport system permease subunit